MRYSTFSVVGMALLGASITGFVYSLVTIVTGIHGSCGSGYDPEVGQLAPCPHHTGFWIVVMVASIFLFIAAVFVYVAKGSPTARSRTATAAIGGIPGISMPSAPFTAPAPTPVPAAQTDFVAQLEQLNQLKESGLLDDAEFQKQKAKILGGST